MNTNKYIALLTYAEWFDKQAGMLDNIGIQHNLKLTKEDLKIKDWLEKQENKLPKEQEEIINYLSSIQLNPSNSGSVGKYLSGPITQQLNSLFERQYSILKKIKKGKIPHIVAAKEYANNKYKIKKLIVAIKEVTSYFK